MKKHFYLVALFLLCSISIASKGRISKPVANKPVTTAKKAQPKKQDGMTLNQFFGLPA